MGGTRNAAAWRRGFLRALARTGNVRMAAEAAGVDHTTAYALRKRDSRFAGAWERALSRAAALPDRPSPLPSPATGRGSEGRRSAPPPQPVRRCSASPEPGAASPLHRKRSPSPAKAGEDLRVVRVSKRHGAQVVRAHETRWSEKKERIFFEALFDTRNVRAAARAAGVSAQALYNRRRESEAFRESWAAVLSESKSQLQMNTVGAANLALEAIDPAEPPAISVKDAMAVHAAVARGEAGASGPLAGRRGGMRPRTATDEEVEAALVKRLVAFGIRVAAEEEEERRQALARCPVCNPPGTNPEP